MRIVFVINNSITNPVHPLSHILFLACTYPWGPLTANTLSINYPEGGGRRRRKRRRINKLYIFLFSPLHILWLRSFLINITRTQQLHHHSIVALDERHIYKESTSPPHIFFLSSILAEKYKCCIFQNSKRDHFTFGCMQIWGRPYIT